MKTYIANTGYRYLIDGELAGTEVYAPDTFDENRLQLITDAEAELMNKEE